jgi:hypothetical protein
MASQNIVKVTVTDGGGNNNLTREVMQSPLPVIVCIPTHGLILDTDAMVLDGLADTYVGRLKVVTITDSPTAAYFAKAVTNPNLVMKSTSGPAAWAVMKNQQLVGSTTDSVTSALNQLLAWAGVDPIIAVTNIRS